MSALGMAIGSSYAGKKSMTATSGPGVSLMIELLGLAAMGGHGEIQRIVLAPVSVSDCFTQAFNAFNLSEQFQMPVMLMGDTTLGVRTESIPTPDLSQYQIVNRLGIAG